MASCFFSYAALPHIHIDVDLLPRGKPRTVSHPIAMMLYRDGVYESSQST
jgi:hypothetical protein